MPRVTLAPYESNCGIVLLLGGGAMRLGVNKQDSAILNDNDGEDFASYHGQNMAKTVGLRINNFMINISNTSGRAINILESECWY
jgi:hypothetical protein